MDKKQLKINRLQSKVEAAKIRLRMIKKYHPPEWFGRNAEKMYGLSPKEALEMAYENMQIEAARALRELR